MDEQLQLGPFCLRHPIGKGGMGMVWRADHETQNHPVAIKVMTSMRAREERFWRAFREEVRAVARLHHDNIIRVFDSGAISKDAERITDGHMIAGSPYVAMELADSTLATIKHQELSWPHVRLILLRVLDALAHSHARGLIHRDLKPDNVLFLPDEAGAKLKLSDFGIAHAMNATRHLKEEDERISGTPRYMAPEQITGQMRDQGPWTDLYALGCLAYWLTSGAPPFSADTIDEVLRSHLFEPRPPLVPRIDVPDGFDLWLERLLAIDPAHRYRRAADAATQLAGLGGGAETDELTLVAVTNQGDSMDMTIADGAKSTYVLEETLLLAHSAAEMSSSPRADIEMPRPEIPSTWRHQGAAPDSIQMLGVGLGLYGLRQIPLVGREDERDLLWQAMTDVHHTGRPHAVTLVGPAGIGKTRLAHWLARRGHELGAVDVLKASHSPISSPAHGLSRMFADFLGCTGLARDEILERVRHFYSLDGPVGPDDLHQCMALTELLARGADPDFSEDDARVRFGTPEEKFVVWKRLMVKLGRRRLPLLFLDDIHWGSDTLQFVRYLLDESNRSDVPALVVMTVRREALEDYPMARGLLQELRQRPFVEWLALGPLSESDHTELIHNLLGLEAHVAEEVAHRTAGNPLFAIQLVGDWVERGVLELSEEGFRLPDGVDAPLPEDVHHLLVQRLEELVGQHVDDPPQDELIALELAAALGREVSYREWMHVCRLASVATPTHLLDEMAARSLARVGDRGWTFVHGALRETLERVARDHGRLPEHHRLCAQMLESVYDASRKDVAPRRARHLLAAGEDEMALQPLIEGVRHYLLTSAIDSAAAMEELHADTLRKLDVGDDDRRVIEGWLERAMIQDKRAQVKEAIATLERAEEVCRRNEWSQLLGKIFQVRALIVNLKGEPEEALDVATKALAIFEDHDDERGIAISYNRMAWALYLVGELARAQRLMEKSNALFNDLDDKWYQAETLSGTGSIHFSLGNYDRARDFLVRARKVYDEIGDLAGVSKCFNNVGDVYRYRGDLTQAAECYSKAVQLRERLGLERNVVQCLNLGIAKLEQHAFEEAATWFEEARDVALSSERTGFLGVIYAGLAAGSAGSGDWNDFDNSLAQASRCLKDNSLVATDLIPILRLAGEQAHLAGYDERAETAYRLALEQAPEEGDAADVVEAVEEALNALTSASR